MKLTFEELDNIFRKSGYFLRLDFKDIHRWPQKVKKIEIYLDDSDSPIIIDSLVTPK